MRICPRIEAATGRLFMRRQFVRAFVVLSLAGVFGLAARTAPQGPNEDFGDWVAHQIEAHSQILFGFSHPLESSAIGPYVNPDSTKALELAQGLTVTLISSAVHHSTDQIAMWPDDNNPAYLFVCDEESSSPAVQRVDLSKPANVNATTIVTGLSACDPVRRTPWGTIIVAEEAGSTGGFYEIMDPANINGPIAVLNRDLGTTSDPAHLVKRKAVGSLSFESFAIKEDGTMIYGDELAPSGGANGGGIYKFVPAFPFAGGGPISIASASPLDSGKVYGLRVAASKSS